MGEPCSQISFQTCVVASSCAGGGRGFDFDSTIHTATIPKNTSHQGAVPASSSLKKIGFAGAYTGTFIQTGKLLFRTSITPRTSKPHSQLSRAFLDGRTWSTNSARARFRHLTKSYALFRGVWQTSPAQPYHLDPKYTANMIQL